MWSRGKSLLLVPRTVGNQGRGTIYSARRELQRDKKGRGRPDRGLLWSFRQAIMVAQAVGGSGDGHTWSDAGYLEGYHETADMFHGTIGEMQSGNSP